MAEEQLSALLDQLKEDAGLREKRQRDGNIDAAVALAKEAGLEMSKADWLEYQVKMTRGCYNKNVENCTVKKASQPEAGNDIAFMNVRA